MRPLLLLALTCGSLFVQAQTVVITFEATLNGSPTPLDSILVMNLTQGGDTIIYFPDNTLVLGTTSLNEHSGLRPVLAAMPNPFETSTEVHVAIASMSDLMLQVHDASGREVASLRTSGAPGVHRFRFTAPAHGVYLMSVTQEGQRSVHRMVATEGSGNVADLRHMGADAMRGEAKSDRSAFLWEPGEELRYIGYATEGDVVHSDVIQEVPTASVTHTFDLAIGALCPDSPTVMDIDGNVYSTVQIGDQCWMAANLRTSTYNDGSTIPNVTTNTVWSQLNSGAWCNYANNIFGYDATYGKLYNWYAAANPNICPQAWHVPTDAEWQQLEAALGMPTGELGQTGGRGAAQNVGGKMKTTTLWNAPHTGANNESGFSGLPGGYRANNGYFVQLGDSGPLWSASESGAEFAWIRSLYHATAGVNRTYLNKKYGICLRCVRD